MFGSLINPDNGTPIPRGVETSLHPKYRSDIDGLRAVAVLAVVGYHAFPGWVRSGFVGVDIFFVISGFLISTIIMENLEAGRFSYFDFYSRRIRRVFPALAVMLGIVLLIGWICLFPVEFQALGENVAAGAAFFSNFLLWKESGYFDKAAEFKPLLHLWSLGIEEQYYIFWPLILSIASKKRDSLPYVIVATGVLSFGANIIGIRVDPVATFYSPVTRVWELMVGSALAYCSVTGTLGKTIRIPGAGETLSGIGAIFLSIGFLTITNGQSFPGWWATLPTLGSAFLIAGGSKPWINRWLLSNRLMVFVGKISYPLYLWHWPLLSFAHILYGGPPPPATKLFLILAALLLAWVTYLFIERPIRFGGHSSNAVPRLVAVLVSIALAGVYIYLDNGVSSRSIVENNADSLQVPAFDSNPQSPCPGLQGDVISKNKLCSIYRAESSSKTIVLWGDSSTGAWLPVFLDVGKHRSYTVINVMHPSCPPVLAARKTRFDFQESRDYCKDGQMQIQVVEAIERFHPDLIVVIANWNSYSEQTHREFITDRPNEPADAISTRRTLHTRVPETLEKLTAIGRTVVFRSWPMMPTQAVPRALGIPWIVSSDTNARGPDVSLIDFAEDSREINSIFDRLKMPQLSFFDPSRKICGSGTCKSHVDGVNFYSDSYHISVAGALSFRTEVEELLSN